MPGFATPGLIGARPAVACARADEMESGGVGIVSATTIVPDGVMLRWSALGPEAVGERLGMDLLGSGASTCSKPFASCQPVLNLNFDWRRRGTGVK